MYRILIPGKQYFECLQKHFHVTEQDKFDCDETYKFRYPFECARGHRHRTQAAVDKCELIDDVKHFCIQKHGHINKEEMEKCNNRFISRYPKSKLIRKKHLKILEKWSHKI